MARIRSVKPDFFTSEVIASLPLSARLTFLGLWTYVDDNGVGLDNERLILAAIWPLEDDPASTLVRLRDDLNRLASAGNDEPILVRYWDSGRKLLFVTHFDEHQKVSHPRKPRYPRPPEGVIHNPSGNPPEDSGNPPEFSGGLRTDSAESAPCQPGQDTPEDYEMTPETFRPEQGAGSREQGAGKAQAEVVTTSVEVDWPAPQNGHKDLAGCAHCGAALDPDGTCFACREPQPVRGRHAR